ncbi:MAG: TonB-dependent receptor, partial [Bacteroidales bacterium]|nr:TonB-dependent receptor [Bacteroidales bacterium]
MFLLSCECAFSQAKRFTVSGNISDGATGEDLIGATVYVQGLETGTTANAYGFYSITLPAGKYRLVFSFVGYKPLTRETNFARDERLNIKLFPEVEELQEVVISSEGKNANVMRTEMSVERISMKTLKRIPALMGEVDVIKAIQLLPGVQSTSEGSSGFSVRGGSHDQNLILLDEATVYNASHLMGFFSVFNNDALKDVVLYKGDIPATFGGRLSSLLDVRSRDGNNQKFSATGGIGTISSRLTVEGPIFSEKLSYLLSGRRTYADLFLLLSNRAELRSSRLYFYDTNGKINYRINDNNRLFLAAYLGRDKFSNRIAGMDFGNQTLSLRWNHIFSPKLFSNFTLIGSFYDYYIKAQLTDQLSMDWQSKMQDFGFKADFSWHISPSHNLKFGYHALLHNFSPGKGGGLGENSIIALFRQPWQHALEHAAFVSNETKIHRLTLKYGLRYSLFQNIGNGEQMYTLENYAVKDSAVYAKGSVYHNTGQWEPRLGILYAFNSVHSMKASYSRTVQFIQLASNSASGSPLDVWFQSTPNVPPQLCDQFAIGYFRNFLNDMLETSVEIYYKDVKHVIDFKDHANLIGNTQLERELRFGKGKAYGVELMIRKNEGKLNGWLSYTFSAARRKIDDINDGNWYRSPYDKPNNISVVMNYELSPRIFISANWVYASGMPVTYPVGRYEIEGRYVPVYSKRNESRYPDYHRLDLAAAWTFKTPPGKRFKSELNLSLYNAYGRHNPWTIMFRQEDDNRDKTYAEAVYLFSFVPAVTWNFT